MLFSKEQAVRFCIYFANLTALFFGKYQKIRYNPFVLSAHPVPMFFI